MPWNAVALQENAVAIRRAIFVVTESFHAYNVG